MKTIVITDPCYLIDGKDSFDEMGDHCGVVLSISDELFEWMQQNKPEVTYDDVGTFWFGVKYPIEDYEKVGSHCNDAGLVCVADYDNIEKFDWNEFLSSLKEVEERQVSCKDCNGTGVSEEMRGIVDKDSSLSDEDRERFSQCISCMGRKTTVSYSVDATLQNYKYILMAGSTFIGDVGSTVWVRKDSVGQVTSLAIDVCGFSFGEDEDEI